MWAWAHFAGLEYLAAAAAVAGARSQAARCPEEERRSCWTLLGKFLGVSVVVLVLGRRWNRGRRPEAHESLKNQHGENGIETGEQVRWR